MEILTKRPERMSFQKYKELLREQSNRRRFKTETTIKIKSMENLLGCKGRKFSAKINGTEVSGRIQVESGKAYLCQDKRNGSDCSDKLGFKYSWIVRTGTKESLIEEGVTDLRIDLTTAEIEEYKDWQVGDEVTDGCNEWTVIFRSGELVVCKKERGGASDNYTCKELYNDGFRLKETPIEEEPTELTMDQIAEKFGVPVSNLKIKKD